MEVFDLGLQIGDYCLLIHLPPSFFVFVQVHILASRGNGCLRFGAKNERFLLLIFLFLVLDFL